MNPRMPEPITSEELQSSSPVVPKQHRTRDGVDEIHLAVWTLGCGLFILLESNSQSGSIWKSSFFKLVYGLSLLTIVQMGISNLRKRVPRLQLPGTESESDVNAISVSSLVRTSAFVLAFLGVYYALDRLKAPSELCDGVVGLMMTGIYAWRRVRIVRWKRLIAAILALGMMLIAARRAPHPGFSQRSFSHVLLFYGLMILVSGGITLWQFLHDPQPPPQEAR